MLAEISPKRGVPEVIRKLPQRPGAACNADAVSQLLPAGEVQFTASASPREKLSRSLFGFGTVST